MPRIELTEEEKEKIRAAYRLEAEKTIQITQMEITDFALANGYLFASLNASSIWNFHRDFARTALSRQDI